MHQFYISSPFIRKTEKKFVVLYPMAEDYRYDIFFSFLINLYR